MSHHNDTLSRAMPENNSHENPILSPTPSPKWPRSHTSVSVLVVAAMIISGLLCVIAMAVALFLFLEGFIRGNDAAISAAGQWAAAAGASVFIGWGATLVGLAFLILRERAARNV